MGEKREEEEERRSREERSRCSAMAGRLGLCMSNMIGTGAQVLGFHLLPRQP